MHQRKIAQHVGPGDRFSGTGGPTDALKQAVTNAVADYQSLSSLKEVRRQLIDESFVLLQDVFDVGLMPDTPHAFAPVTDCEGADHGRIAALIVHGLLGLETVSYGSENQGQLFVNLVALPGEGVVPEKSRSEMRGHTDAASFPFRGQSDKQYPQIAPSPDTVTLVGLRNPDAVPTTLMKLSEIVQNISLEDVRALQEHGFLISAQRTFVRGTEKILGAPHAADSVPVLWNSPEGLWVRYSHSHVAVLDEDNLAQRQAKDSFQAAANKCKREVVVQPGSILIVNNRNTLHGRGPVGGKVGAQSRWLLRTYGLSSAAIKDSQRYPDVHHQLFP